MVLGAGSGTRLRPLTLERPKILCPVGGRPLVDHALDRFAGLFGDRATGPSVLGVNVHRSHASSIVHLEGRVHLSVEDGEAQGTAGGLARFAPWLDGRHVVVVNGDTWCPGGLDALVAGWDGERIRILVGGSEPLGPRSAIAGAAMPWSDVVGLPRSPSGLWEVSWRDALSAGRVEAIHHHGPLHDCATPADYLRINLALSRGASAVDPTAIVHGRVERTVVWPGATVGRSEHLVDAIRTTGGRTVLIRGSGRAGSPAPR